MADALFSLEGRVALVTGGSRGIGRMIAKGFIDRGARVYITSRKAEACAATADALGPACIPLPQDLSTLAGIDRLVEDLRAAEPCLDILVNNAGAVWGASFEQFPESGWDKVLDLNLKSPFFLVKKLLPMLQAASSSERPAKVINIASIDGMTLPPNETYSYQAAKSALIFVTRSLAARLARDQIIVNAIAPGPFVSEMNRVARDNCEALAQQVPLGRIGCDDDMAAAAIYLASRAGDFVVGATLPVDGGVALATTRTF